MALAKKGDASDPLVLLLILVFLAVSFIVVIFTNTKLQSVIEDTALNESTAAPSIIRAFDRVNGVTVQRGFTIMFALSIIFMMVSAFLVRVHPIFIFIYIITLGVTIFTSVFLANMYEALISNEQLATVAADQVQITWIMQHVVHILLGAGALSMVIIFAKIFSPPVGGADI